MGVGGDRWRVVADEGLPPHPGKNEDVEEVHHAENEKHDAHFLAQCFENVLGYGDLSSDLQVESDEADIDEVKANNQQMIHAVGEFLISLETVDEEDSTIAMKGLGDPNGEHQAQHKIDGVGDDD